MRYMALVQKSHKEGKLSASELEEQNFIETNSLTNDLVHWRRVLMLEQIEEKMAHNRDNRGWRGWIMQKTWNQTTQNSNKSATHGVDRAATSALDRGAAPSALDTKNKNAPLGVVHAATIAVDRSATTTSALEEKEASEDEDEEDATSTNV